MCLRERTFDEQSTVFNVLLSREQSLQQQQKTQLTKPMGKQGAKRQHT